MSNFMLSHLLFRHNRAIIVTSQRYQRGPFGLPKRPYAERNKHILDRHKGKRLQLAEPADKPNQWKLPETPKDPKVVERKLPSPTESALPYEKYSNEDIHQIKSFETFYDPLFNPLLHEEKYKIDPQEEPFKTIYKDCDSEANQDYTKVRDITTPELWQYVERLARIKVAPEPPKRKAGEPVTALPSGFVPPPESPPDLPYFVPRTRNYLLPVYYQVHSDPEQCYTILKQIKGDLWQLEEDLRVHLESLADSPNRRILTSVQETDDIIQFRGRHIHQIVDWLHHKGF